MRSVSIANMTEFLQHQQQQLLQQEQQQTQLGVKSEKSQTTDDINDKNQIVSEILNEIIESVIVCLLYFSYFL